MAVNVTGRGVAAGTIVLDGTLDPTLYGAAKVLQTNPTGFGDNQSELDGAYAKVVGSNLHVMLTGNLQNNGNKVVLFVDSRPNAGQSTLTNTNPDVDFNRLNAMAGLRFDPAFTSDYFFSVSLGGTSAFVNYAPTDGSGGAGTYLSSAGNALTQQLVFGGLVPNGEFAINNANTAGVSDMAVGNPGAVTTGLEFRIPLSAIGNPTATTPLRIMALITNGDYNYVSNQSLAGLPMGTGNLGGDGAGNFTGDVTGVDFGAFAGYQFFTVQRGNIAVSDTRAVGGDYNNVVVLNGGYALASGPVDVTGAFQVRNGGQMRFENATALATGTGSFDLQAGGAVEITSPAGIAASGNAGQVRTATRSFSEDGSYSYGTPTGAVFSTGTGLPATVRNLNSTQADQGTNTLILSQDVRVRNRVFLGGDVVLDGKKLRLLVSNPTGAAYIDNNNGEGGVVDGSTGEMECGLSTVITGVGYRHYSSPMSGGVNINDLNTTGFTPVVNSQYNTTPYADRFVAGAVTPFPNVFRYDEALVATDFAEGWQSPASLTDAMEAGRGYTAAMTARPKVIFTGQFQNDEVIANLTNTANNAQSGWNLLGNPFPQPINWADATIPTGMSGQVSVWQPATGALAQGGSYLTFVNGMGGSFDGVIPAMNGLFVRRTSNAGPLAFTFEHAMRTASHKVHYRPAPTADQRPVMQLVLRGTGALAAVQDEALVYFEAGATAGADDRFDGLKVGFSTGDVPTLATRLPGGELAQIDGRPLLTQETVVPLVVQVSRTGSYVLDLTAVRNFAPGQRIFLEDAVTGTVQDLTQQPTYQFSMDRTFRGNRFTVRFEAAGTVTGLNAAADARLSVYPNPSSSGAFRVEWNGAQPLTGTLVVTDGLGRTVRQQAVTGLNGTVVEGLPKGIYVLRVTTEAGPQVRRVVVE